MQANQVRQFVERYLATFSAHIVEAHPDYLTVKLPVEVDKDIGNRPFYWSWVDKMNLAYQPLVLTFAFHPDRIPDGLRAEYLHLGAVRMQQIFASAKKHGRFLCMYEQSPASLPLTGKRRSTPLVPWLGLNLKVSLLCDKRRDIMLYLGINLHQPRLVHDFSSFLFQLPLTPAIPDYFYTLDRKLSVEDALELAKQEVDAVIAQEDHTWALEARARLTEELDILAAYYEELARREPPGEQSETEAAEAEGDEAPGQTAPVPQPARETVPAREPVVEAEQTLDEYRSSGGRILDFLRANGVQVTPREEINQEEWKKSTPEEEKQRRMDELRWQYEPRIEVHFINGGLFYLHSTPPVAKTRPAKTVPQLPASGRIV
ncbi:YqhG family protein [Brevibacillus sp. SAFN-007a]|uniref:YqhG family protein n=1 Tax=Brevibacillus sp. SAFN-007a TaxID=3436862 RepID=UPI003F817B01